MTNFLDKQKELVQAAAGGDIGAFRRIYDHYLHQVTCTVGRYLGPGPELEDVVQEAFVALYGSLSSVSDYDTFGGWVYRVSRNIALSHLRKSSRSIDFVALKTLRDPSNQWENLTTREALRALYLAMECLSDDHREALIMYEIEGMTLQEIADLTEASINTVASRVRRGREQLIKIVKQTRSTATESGELA